MNRYPLVPAAPFLEIYDRYRAETGCEDEALCERIGITTRRMYAIREQETLAFDRADAIVTYTYGPMLWWEDKELTEIYLAADLGEKPSGKDHGTRSRYVNQGCRCDLCVEANTDYYRKRERV